jgi:hypothetical protein
MGRVKPRKSDSEREKSILLAKKEFLAGIEPSIRSAALPMVYYIPPCVIACEVHNLLLTDQEEKSIVCYCNTLDDYGHPVNMRILKGFAKSLLPVSSLEFLDSSDNRAHNLLKL